jgi:hypothetical protein
MASLGLNCETVRLSNARFLRIHSLTCRLSGVSRGEQAVSDVQGDVPLLWHSREQTTSDTQNNFCRDDTRFKRPRRSSSILDEQTKGNHEETASKDDERLEPSNMVDNHSEEGSGENRGKGIERSNPCCALDALVERDYQDRIEVASLHRPRKVEGASDSESGPYAAVLQQVERYQWVPGTHFPKDEDWDAAESNHERCD